MPGDGVVSLHGRYAVVYPVFHWTVCQEYGSALRGRPAIKRRRNTIDVRPKGLLVC